MRSKPLLVSLLCCQFLGCQFLVAAEPVPPAELSATPDGRMHLVADGTELITFTPFSADGAWKFGFPTAVTATSDEPIRFTVAVGANRIPGTLVAGAREGQIDATWTYTPTSDVAFNALAISGELSLSQAGGGTWDLDGKQGSFPKVFGNSSVFSGEIRKAALTLVDGRSLHLAFPQPTQFAIQDNRKWGGQTFTLRIGRGMGRLAAKQDASVAMTVSVPQGLTYRRELPVTLAASDEWLPLTTELEIVPGSALDLSSCGLTDGPCGTKGRVIATPEGHFAYADDPRTPRRFYGVNLCFSSLYLPKAQVDTLLDRLVRLGYNTVRIHHYEYRLTATDWKPGFDWYPARVDQLDYLMAGCAKRGLWLTTDLYVSRPVPGKQIGLTGDKPDANNFKLMVPVHELAFQDWATFSRKFLDHVNPYTGRRVAEEPALAWVSLINEGPIAGAWDSVKKSPAWSSAWNRWLVSHFPERAALDAALGDRAANEDPTQGTVKLPEELHNSNRGRLAQVFLGDTEATMVERMRRLLRDELKCPALLTDINCGGAWPAPVQGARATFDYVDDHFYVDHPSFMDQQWRLPSQSPNANPIREGAPGGRSSAAMRLFGKPFVVSEFNYSGPGRFRGVGGVLTGALAALQDWDAVWRFAYAHKDEALFAPTPIDYFNLANDPLNQAADRAAVLLYLRRDLNAAPHQVTVAMPVAALRDPPAKLSLAGTESFAWVTRIGCSVLPEGATPPAEAAVVPLSASSDQAAVAAALQARGVTLPENDDHIRSETGQLAIDRKRGVLTIDTPRTAGGYADAGQSIAASNAGVSIDSITTGATVFVSSLDQTPIRSAKRLLVTHLTDLQNTGAHYGESARQTLLGWGTLPHLVRAGSATVHLALAEPKAYQVWSLATSGRRLAQVPVTVDASGLTFTATVASADGARMLYEVTR
jgi:hypothetical protein